MKNAHEIVQQGCEAFWKIRESWKNKGDQASNPYISGSDLAKLWQEGYDNTMRMFCRTGGKKDGRES